MTEPFTLDEYRCVNPPKRLWRVTHGNSQSRWDRAGLLAADDSLVFHDEAELKEAVQHHIDWSSSRPSCFLSVFNDENHAVNWATQREKKDPPAYIHEIDTDCLPLGVEILDMELLMAQLGIENPYSDHELLFLHCIPSRCIIHNRAVCGAQPDTGYSGEMWCRARIQHEERFRFHDSQCQFYDFDEDCCDLYMYGPERGDGWGHYLDADSDSNESAEERNLNDDLVKMIDG